MRTPYTPPAARVADIATASSIGGPWRSARITATWFAGAAAVVVVAGTIVSGLLPNSDPGAFGSPSLLETLIAAAFFALGAFIWSWGAVACSARLFGAVTSGSIKAAIALGAAFALLTPALGFALDRLGIGFGVAVLSLGLWVIAFPAIAALFLVRSGSAA